MDLARGANAEIDGTTFDLSWERPPGSAEIDISAYLLTDGGKVRGDQDMLFFNQLAVPGLTMKQGPQGATFTLAPAAIDPAIVRIAFCAAIDGSNDPAARLADAGAIAIRNGAHSFRADMTGAPEAALIMAEVYLRQGQWKLRAVGQGFAGGLAALARSFGMEVADEPAPAAPPPPPPPPAINLTKITLAKVQTVSLRKGAGAIRARLIWLGDGPDGEGDLDFYCFYVLADGICGKVYWNDHGKDDAAPFITLSGDSMSAGEEEIILNKPEALRFALFAAYSAIDNGAGAFASYRPKMIITDQDGSEVTIPLLHPVETSYWVAISHVKVGNGIAIEHVETYGDSDGPGVECAPRLHADGSWDVSKGEIEFKDDFA